MVGYGSTGNNKRMVFFVVVRRRARLEGVCRNAERRKLYEGAAYADRDVDVGPSGISKEPASRVQRCGSFGDDNVMLFGPLFSSDFRGGSVE